MRTLQGKTLRFLILLGAAWSAKGCLPQKEQSSLSAQDSVSAQGADEEGRQLYAMLETAEAEQLLNYDVDVEEFTDILEIPDTAEQANAQYDPRRYWGGDAHEYLGEYEQLLASSSAFKGLYDELLSLGRVGAQLQDAEVAYDQNASSVMTNLALGKGAEYWHAQANKAQSEYLSLKHQFAAAGFDEVVVIGFSKRSDDLYRLIRGGTGFDAVVEAARAHDQQWQDGLESLGAGPIELILGVGVIKSTAAGMGRAASRMMALKGGGNAVRFLSVGSIKASVSAATNSTKVLIENLIRQCAGLGLAGKQACTNYVAGGLAEGFKHAWIKRELFNELRALAGPVNFKKFQDALKRGVVSPQGQAGVKHIQGPLYELKINGSAMRVLGLKNKNGTFVFTRFERDGLHTTAKANEIIAAMLK